MPAISRSEFIDSLTKSWNTLTFLKGELDTVTLQYSEVFHFA